MNGAVKAHPMHLGLVELRFWSAIPDGSWFYYVPVPWEPCVKVSPRLCVSFSGLERFAVQRAHLEALGWDERRIETSLTKSNLACRFPVRWHEQAFVQIPTGEG